MFVFLLLWSFGFSEGRVHCQDSHATPWMPLGHPCPVTCSTLLTAVERLKIHDYNFLLNEKLKNRSNMSSADLYYMGQKLQKQNIYHHRRNLEPETRRHLKMYNTYHRLLTNENFSENLKKELRNDIYDFRNRTCGLQDGLEFDKKYYTELKGSKCFRRLSKRPEVIEKFTRFLNKFADSKYQFDEEMSAVILQKLEGNLNLRYGQVDFKRIIAYLRKALRFHSSKTHVQIIKLQSKNCITIYVSGCFCKNGYVENHGICVKPEDCLGNSAYLEYLQRIIIH